MSNIFIEMIPTIRFSRDEIDRRSVTPTKFLLGAQVFRSAGVLLLENAFDPGFIATLFEAYCREYQDYFREDEFSDADTVGKRRTMITVALEGVFNTPGLYANELVVPFLQRLLGPACVLNSFGSVVASPGADDQHIHRDHPALFPEQNLDGVLPPFAVNVLVPLVELNRHHGTTRLWKASHRSAAVAADGERWELPVAPRGSCLLMDYRLLHGGTANRSNEVRPILYLIYSRPWFWDYANFSRQPKLIMSKEEFQMVPEGFRHWFSLLGQFGLRYQMASDES